MSIFCLRIPTSEPNMGGVYLTENRGESLVFRDTLKEIHMEFYNFYGFEIVELDNKSNRNVLRSYGIIKHQPESKYDD